MSSTDLSLDVELGNLKQHPVLVKAIICLHGMHLRIQIVSIPVSFSTSTVPRAPVGLGAVCDDSFILEFLRIKIPIIF
jgi:hypothetical protein